MPNSSNIAKRLRKIADQVDSLSGSNGTESPTDSNEFTYRALAQVDHVEDGDTWHGRHRPDPGFIAAKEATGDFPPGLWYRLVGIDTHETGGEHADKAENEKQFVQSFIDTGRDEFDGTWPFIIVYGDNDGDIEGTYGRQLVDLQRRSDGTFLADALLEEFGDDIRYNGRTLDQYKEFLVEDLTGNATDEADPIIGDADTPADAVADAAADDCSGSDD